MAMPVRRLLQIQRLPGRSNWPETRGISMSNEDRIKWNQRYAGLTEGDAHGNLRNDG
jgi:hypothetical protein